MIEVRGIENGIVIDHIKAGTGLMIFNKIFHDETSPVVLLMNVNSQLLGKKDIIKIEGKMDINLDVLGLIDENITVNFIRNGAVEKKIKTSVPKQIKGTIKCHNPRCISHTDEYAVPTYTLVSKGEKLLYSCSFCEEITEFRLQD